MFESPDHERHTRTQINMAYFAGFFGLSQIAEYVGDQIHNPDVIDVPRGAVILLGLGTAAVATVVKDTISRMGSK